jgi:hypothetical protein
MIPKKERGKLAKGSTTKEGKATKKVVIDLESPRPKRAKKGECFTSNTCRSLISLLVVSFVDVPTGSSSTNVATGSSSKAKGKAKAIEEVSVEAQLAAVRANLEEQRAQVEVKKRMIGDLEGQELELMGLL